MQEIVKVFFNNTLLAISIIGIVVFSKEVQSESSDIAVIVHKDNTDELTIEQVSKIFLDKENYFPSGEKAVPIGLDEEEERVVFYKKCTNKSADQVHAYWARRIFTGKGAPPETVLDDEEMLDLVSENPNLIGYVRTESIEEFEKTEEVRVVLTLK